MSEGLWHVRESSQTAGGVSNCQRYARPVHMSVSHEDRARRPLWQMVLGAGCCRLSSSKRLSGRRTSAIASSYPSILFTCGRPVPLPRSGAGRSLACRAALSVPSKGILDFSPGIDRGTYKHKRSACRGYCRRTLRIPVANKYQPPAAFHRVVCSRGSRATYPNTDCDGPNTWVGRRC